MQKIGIEQESTRRSSNKWTKTLYRVYFSTLYYKLLCDCFKYILKRNHFFQHQMLKTNSEIRIKYLKVPVK